MTRNVRPIMFVGMLLGIQLLPLNAATADDKKPKDKAAAERKREEPKPADDFSPELARQLGELLDRDWKERPEWAEMLTVILKGDEMGMGKGWFRPARKRYNWQWLRKRFDADSDKKIAAAELPEGKPRSLYFERLDIDGDRQISKRDFDRRALQRNPQAGKLFYRLDQDSNGRISEEELSNMFKKLDREERGFLTREDLEAIFAPPRSMKASRGGDESRPTPAWWLKLFLSGQLGSLGSGPELNKAAPDFDLRTHDGKSKIKLSSFRGKKPVVLIFGSFT